MTLRADDRMTVAMDMASIAARLQTLSLLVMMEESPYAQQYVAKVLQDSERGINQVRTQLEERDAA